MFIPIARSSFEIQAIVAFLVAEAGEKIPNALACVKNWTMLLKLMELQTGFY